LYQEFTRQPVEAVDVFGKQTAGAKHIFVDSTAGTLLVARPVKSISAKRELRLVFLTDSFLLTPPTIVQVY
jgi:hypothetical protein